MGYPRLHVLVHPRPVGFLQSPVQIERSAFHSYGLDAHSCWVLCDVPTGWFALQWLVMRRNRAERASGHPHAAVHGVTQFADHTQEEFRRKLNSGAHHAPIAPMAAVDTDDDEAGKPFPARRSSAEHLIATKAPRCTATAWMLIVAESFAKI